MFNILYDTSCVLASLTHFRSLSLFRLNVTKISEGFVVNSEVRFGECPAVPVPISEIVGQKEEREEDPLLIFSAFSLDSKIVVRGSAHQNYYSVGEEK